MESDSEDEFQSADEGEEEELKSNSDQQLPTNVSIESDSSTNDDASETLNNGAATDDGDGFSRQQDSQEILDGISESKQSTPSEGTDRHSDNEMDALKDNQENQIKENLDKLEDQEKESQVIQVDDVDQTTTQLDMQNSERDVKTGIVSTEYTSDLAEGNDKSNDQNISSSPESEEETVTSLQIDNSESNNLFNPVKTNLSSISNTERIEDDDQEEGIVDCGDSTNGSNNVKTDDGNNALIKVSEGAEVESVKEHLTGTETVSGTLDIETKDAMNDNKVCDTQVSDISNTDSDENLPEVISKAINLDPYKDDETHCGDILVDQKVSESCENDALLKQAGEHEQVTKNSTEHEGESRNLDKDIKQNPIDIKEESNDSHTVPGKEAVCNMEENISKDVNNITAPSTRKIIREVNIATSERNR